MGVIAAGFIGLVLLIMNAQPTSRVVMLPDADGKSGAVIVKSETGQQLVNTAYGSASVSQRGAITLATEDATQVAQRYAVTLAARPAAPVSFMVYFEFGSAVDIAPVIQPVLEQLQAAMVSYPAAEVTVIGHTDRVGGLELNDTLSLQRAETVRDLILRAGIRPTSMEVAGRGEREPIIPTADEVPEPRNRRVEINLR